MYDHQGKALVHSILHGKSICKNLSNLKVGVSNLFTLLAVDRHAELKNSSMQLKTLVIIPLLQVKLRK